MTKLYGTRFAAACEHSWRRQYPKWTIEDLAGSTTNCDVRGSLLMIPREQFAHIMGEDQNKFPMEVRLVDFHRGLNKEMAGMWPAGREGTFYAEF